MKFGKRLISLFLAILMATSVVTAVDFSAYADYKNGETGADFDAGENNQIFEFNGHTYQFFNTRFSSFEEAEAYCESLGGHLAVIESRDEDKNVYGFLRSLGEMNAFLGVKKNTDGVWVDVYGNVLNKNSYTNWGRGEPNNEGGCEDVLQYYKAYPNGEWNDLYWGKQGIYSFICEWDYVNNNSNIILAKTWDELGISNFHSYLSSFNSLSRAIVNSYDSNEEFVSTASKWKAAHLLAKPGDMYDELFSMKTIYSSILLSMINDRLVDENYFSTIKQQSKLEYSKCYNNFLKLLNECKKIDLEKLKNNGKYTDAERAEIIRRLTKSETKSETIDTFSSAVKWGSTINETINIFVNYSNLNSTKNYIVNCLNSMKNHTDDLFLESAITDMVFATESGFNTYLNAVIKGLENGLNDVGAELINKAWSTVLKSNPITRGMQYGYKIGSSICNVLFKTDKQIANYYEFIALHEIEKALIATIYDFENNYSKTQNTENATNYISSVSLFFKLQYQTVDITNELYEIRNLCPFGRIFYNGKKTFEELSASINELKSTFRTYETNIFRMWIYSLKDINQEVYDQIKGDVSNFYDSSLKNATIKLERLSYDYNGTRIIPKFFVIHNKAVLVENRDYVVEYSDNDKPGFGKIKILPAKGSYYTDSQEMGFVINEPPFKKRYSVFSRNKSKRIKAKRSVRAKASLADLSYDIPNISVYDTNDEVVAQVVNGKIVSEQLPIYIENGRVDVFMYDEDYRISIADETMGDYSAEIQNIDENMKKQSVKSYNNISADLAEHYLYKNGTDKFLVNESELESSYNSNDNSTKYSITLSNSETLDCINEASVNQRVYISATNKEGYYFSDWQVSDDVVLENDKDGFAYFIMPNHDVEISAILSKNEYYFALKEKIKNAKSYSNERYSKASYNELQNVILSAQEINTNFITESEYNNMVERIDNAINSLVECDHQYDVKIFEHSCTEKTTKIYSCTNCGYEKQEIIPEGKHSYVEKENTATCENNGFIKSVCDVCGDILFTDAEALGHIYSKTPTAHKNPTCNSKGYDEYTCSRCNGIRRDEIATLDGSALKSALDESKKRIESGVFTEGSVSKFRNLYDKCKNAADELDNQEDVDLAVYEITTAYESLVIKDIATGTLDNGITWTFIKNGAKLSFTGDGEVPYYAIGSNPWYYCGNIEVLEFGEGITSIAGSAFTKYNTVKKIKFPSTLTTINTRAFEYCNLVEELVIPDSVTFVGYGTFASLTSLKKVTVPASAKYASYAFEHDENIEEIFITPGADSIMPDCTRTGQFGFPFYQNFTGAYGPWRVAKNATVTVQDGVTSIGMNTFYNAVSGNLTINIPASVNNIGKTCFATNGKTVAYVENANCVIDETNLCSSNVNVMVKSENGEYAQKPHTHTWGEWKYNNDAVYNSPTDYKNGTQTRTCTTCGENETVEAPNTGLLRINTVSLSLESSITMNFKVRKSNVSSFDDFYVTFKCMDEEKTVTEYTEQGDYYVFSYKGISPQIMNKDIVGVLHAKSGNTEYTSPEKIMSVKKYAYQMLDLFSSDENYASFRTMIVDLLNYGAASQVYAGYQTDNLVNSELTDVQKSWASVDNEEFKNIKNYDYKTIANPTARWRTSALVLDNSVMLRAKLSADNIENKTVEITCNDRTFTYTKNDFVDNGNGTYYVCCDELYADEMSDDIFLTVYENGVPCSNTMRFSIESYARIIRDNYQGSDLDKLTTAMMLYGKSARAYRG